MLDIHLNVLIGCLLQNSSQQRYVLFPQRILTHFSMLALYFLLHSKSHSWYWRASVIWHQVMVLVLTSTSRRTEPCPTGVACVSPLVSLLWLSPLPGMILSPNSINSAPSQSSQPRLSTPSPIKSSWHLGDVIHTFMPCFFSSSSGNSFVLSCEGG